VVRKEKEMLETVAGKECEIFMADDSVQVEGQTLAKLWSSSEASQSEFEDLRWRLYNIGQNFGRRPATWRDAIELAHLAIGASPSETGCFASYAGRETHEDSLRYASQAM
jgi:hypothetical protein